jgi:hypothetical protein
MENTNDRRMMASEKAADVSPGLSKDEDNSSIFGYASTI